MQTYTITCPQDQSEDNQWYMNLQDIVGLGLINTSQSYTLKNIDITCVKDEINRRTIYQESPVNYRELLLEHLVACLTLLHLTV